MSQPKVYEFAKEIGIETLVLMNKIRHWKLPVKSHMAELPPEIIEQIHEKLDEESGVKKKKTTKKTTKKKTKKTTKKTTKKATTRKKTSVKKAVSEKQEVEEKKTLKKTIIRRKKPSPKKETPPSDEALDLKKELASTTASQGLVQQETTNLKDQQPKTSEKKETKASEKTSSTSLRRKREVMMTEEGPVSGVKSETSRPNVVGKIDLNKIESKGATGVQRYKKTSTRNIRAGFVAADTPHVPPQRDIDSPYRKDKEKRKKVINVSSPSKKDYDQSPSFVSSDFKKREVVFQPKKKKIATNVADFKKTEITTPSAHKRIIRIHGTMKVSDLADSMSTKSNQLIKTLMKSGVICNLNTDLDFETISLIAPDFGYEAQNIRKSDEELIGMATFGDLDAEKVGRPPVVTVMGHVDHGKTTLLDNIRKSKVAQGEAGGITQHIGAYRIKTKIGECTFLDTPGHEAFTAMRLRGANATDIVILVVAADDGVMPQTVEAINHSKLAKVPIIVAINKMDRPSANPDRIKQQLAEHDLVPEDWGGSTLFVPISALKGDGIDELLEQISLLAELQELKANPKRSATGLVVESRVEKGKGNTATLLVKDGTLKSGQFLVIGQISCRIRQLFDESGNKIEKAGPSHPVEVIGLPSAPQAGDSFDVCRDEKTAESIAEQRALKRLNEQKNKQKTPANLEEIFSEIKANQLKELPVVLKTDVAGTGEAIASMFEKISTDEVKIKIIHQAVGGISVSDVLLASTAGGVIVGFNTRPDSNARSEAKQRSVEIKTYSVVYNLIDEMKAAMSGLLEPDIVEKFIGRMEVRNTFNVPKAGTIAGSFVLEGKVTRNCLLRLVRDGTVIYTGKVNSLKRFKDSAKEVSAGYECGIGIENFNDIKVGDEIEAFVEEEVTRTL